jgi:DNA adenine methylase
LQKRYGSNQHYIINDIDENLINFYKIVENSDLNELTNYFELNREKYNLEQIKGFREILKNKLFENEIEWAFYYYTCVYCGYGGKPYATPTKDKYSNYAKRDIKKDLQKCKNSLCNFDIDILNKEYKNIIFSNSFYYCDPPYCKVGATEYYGQNGENHKNFNHEDFFNFVNMLSNMNNKIMISYEDSEPIRKLYKNWNIIGIDKNTTNYNPKTKKSDIIKTNELLIMNY